MAEAVPGPRRPEGGLEDVKEEDDEDGGVMLDQTWVKEEDEAG
jgi:hypothetical protein